MDGLTEGRIVHYVIQTGPSHGQHRPAIVVKVWNKESGVVNLIVFADWSNDGVADSAYWATSVRYDEETKAPGTWHWIEKA